MEAKLKEKKTRTALPLRDRNMLHNRCKKSSIPSATVVQTEGSKRYSRLLPSSSSTTSASSRTIHLPKISSTVTNHEPKISTALVKSKVAPRSKQNVLTTKPISLGSNKNHTKQINKKNQYIRSVQSSKNLPNQSQPVKRSKGSKDVEVTVKISKSNSSNEQPTESDLKSCCVVEARAFDGTTGSGCNFDSLHGPDPKDSILLACNNNGGATPVKTPPIESSLSPEIQCGSHLKMPVYVSGATPLCYGTGHILSGVPDMRKCRRRGSLRGGCEKTNIFFDDDTDYENVVDDDSMIPFPTEASVRWISSPCDEAKEDDHECETENMFDLCGTVRDNDSVVVDYLLFSPSTMSVIVSNCTLDCGKYGVDGTLDDVQDTVKAKENDLDLSKTFELSADSLSSKNMIQTPDSGSNSESCVAGSKLGIHHRSSIEFEFDSITESLSGIDSSLVHETSIWNAPVDGPQTNISSLSSSWISDVTLDNLALSQIDISWRDGLRNKIEEIDESDCCRCFSDEEIDVLQCSDQQVNLHHLSASKDGKEKDMNSGIASPVLLEYEPSIASKRKEIFCPSMLNACAESICTNGGDLAASADSDWSYFK